MSRPDAPNQISVQTALESGKAVPRQPEAVRSRVLARARATVASPPVQPSLPPHAHPLLPHYLTMPVVAGALALGVAAGVRALNDHASSAPAARRVPPASVASAVLPPALPGAPPRALIAPPPAVASVAPGDSAPTAESSRPRAHHHAETPQSYEAELGLMRNAHTAYAAHEFANALVLVGEHARRFPAGLLAEEREALRVRCLLGSGRTSEARRAAAAFASRFPRSVLVSRLQAEVGTGAE